MKAILRTCSGQEGNLFMKLKGAKHDRDLIHYKNMGRRMSHMNVESMNRPGKWQSMMAATVRHAAPMSQKYIPGIIGDVEKLEKTIQAIHQI